MARKRVSEMNETQRQAYEEYKARRKAQYVRKLEPKVEVKKEPKPKKRYNYECYVADFETSTEKWFNIEGRTRIWAWALTPCYINSDKPNDLTDNAKVLTSKSFNESPSESWLNILENVPEFSIIYFHNLKFDGTFILNLLIDAGFKDHGVVKAKNDQLNPGEFSLVGDSSHWYLLKVRYKTKTIEIRDSLKRIPMSVREMALEYKLPILKGDINYDRDPSLPMSDEEEKYIRHDVLIVAEILRQQYQEGFTDLTTASFAFNSYKKWLNKKFNCDFKDIFPRLESDDEAFVRLSYDGGEVWCNPTYQGKFIGNPFSDKKTCFTWDVNSMFPAVYSSMPMPYGEPTYYEGYSVFEQNGMDPMDWKKWRGQELRYFISFERLVADLKPGRVPSFGIPCGFGKRDYPSHIEIGFNVLCDVRFERLFLDYDVKSITPLTVCVYRANCDLFFDYIQDIVKEKNKASIEGNLMKKVIAKTKMNSLYGKFGQKGASLGCKFEHDDKSMLTVSHYINEIETKYIPVASIITAEGRELLISQANKFGYDNVVYMDTDSIHVLQDIEIDGKMLHHNVESWRRRPLPTTFEEKENQMNSTYNREELYNTLIEFEYGRPNEIWCDEYDLGAFKIEGNFTCGKWVRAKTYFEGSLATEEDERKVKEAMEDETWNGESFIIRGKDFNLYGVIKGAGIPVFEKNQITIDNFDIGLRINGRKLPKRVKGGVILVDTVFEIKDIGTVIVNDECKMS